MLFTPQHIKIIQHFVIMMTRSSMVTEKTKKEKGKKKKPCKISFMLVANKIAMLTVILIVSVLFALSMGLITSSQCSLF
jgi:hypothetical protein